MTFSQNQGRGSKSVPRDCHLQAAGTTVTGAGNGTRMVRSPYYGHRDPCRARWRSHRSVVEEELRGDVEVALGVRGIEGDAEVVGEVGRLGRPKGERGLLEPRGGGDGGHA